MNISNNPSVWRYYPYNKASSQRADDIIKYCNENNIPHKITSGSGVGKYADRSLYITVEKQYVDQVRHFINQLDDIYQQRENAINININNKFPYNANYLVKQLGYIFPNIVIKYNPQEVNKITVDDVIYTIDRAFITKSKNANGSMLLMRDSENNDVLIFHNKFASEVYHKGKILDRTQDISAYPLVEFLKTLAVAHFTGEQFDKYINDIKIYISYT